MHMTLEERERRAYIEGRTEEAVLLGAAADAENVLATREKFVDAELEKAEDKIGELETRLDDANAEVESLKDDLLAADSRIESLERERTALEDTLALVG